MKFLITKNGKIERGWRKFQEKYEDLNVLVVDTNLAIDHALRLAEDGCTVYYYVADMSAFPKLQDTISGEGFDLNKISDMYEVIDNIDLAIITDSCFPDLPQKLRDNYGISTIGSSPALAEWENNRVKFLEDLDNLGIDTPESVLVKGVDKLYKYITELHLKEDEKVWIKINKYRGNIETFSVNSAEEAKTILMQAGFGPFLEMLEFIVQRESEGIEIGVDVFVSPNIIYEKYLYTIEYKGRGNIAIPCNNSGFDDVYNKIMKEIVKSNYRGNLSFEGFYNGDTYKVIDATPRFAYPCSTLWAKYIKNYTDVLLAVADNKDIDVEWDEGYYVQISLTTDKTDVWKMISFSDDLRKNIGFRRVVKKDNSYWFVPGDALVATVNVKRDTLEQAFNNADEIAKEISCPDTQYTINFKEKAIESVKQLNKWNDFKFTL